MSFLDRLLGRTHSPATRDIYKDVPFPAAYPGLNGKYEANNAKQAHFPLMKVLKGFLLFDKDLYDTDISQDSLDASVAFLKAAHQSLGTMTAQHIEDGDNIEITGYCEAQNQETGGYISYLEYRIPMKDQFNHVVKFDWSSLLMGRIDLEETSKRNLLTLMFGMTGFTIMPNDGASQQHIVPVDMFCRTGDNTLMVPTDIDSLICSMAYANQSFIQLMSGLQFDPAANQSWFEERRYVDADTLCSRLDCRTMSSFAADILEYYQAAGLAPQ